MRCNSLCIDEWCGVLNRLGKITYPEKETLGGIPSTRDAPDTFSGQYPEYRISGRIYGLSYLIRGRMPDKKGRIYGAFPKNNNVQRSVQRDLLVWS